MSNQTKDFSKEELKRQLEYLKSPQVAEWRQAYPAKFAEDEARIKAALGPEEKVEEEKEVLLKKSESKKLLEEAGVVIPEEASREELDALAKALPSN